LGVYSTTESRACEELPGLQSFVSCQVDLPCFHAGGEPAMSTSGRQAAREPCSDAPSDRLRRLAYRAAGRAAEPRSTRGSPSSARTRTPMRSRLSPESRAVEFLCSRSSRPGCAGGVARRQGVAVAGTSASSPRRDLVCRRRSVALDRAAALGAAEPAPPHAPARVLGPIGLLRPAGDACSAPERRGS
jgi:hypothetical protein